MQTSKLARTNIKARLKDYLVFLISNTMLVAIFYTFASIFLNESFEVLMGNDYYKSSFYTFAIVVIIFTTVFVWYSTSFFISKRKKEIATYLLLGMSKKQVFQMLFLEQMMIGLISLVSGLLIGLLFFKLSTMFLLSLMKLNIDINLMPSLDSILTSIGIFALIYVINAILVASLVHRVKLINLYKASSSVEKKIKINWIFGLLGFGLLIAGYGYSVYEVKNLPMNITDLLSIVLLVIAGTYLFMSSFLNILIGLNKKSKKVYYKTSNLISFSGLAFRIRSNAVTLATIAILNGMVLTALAGVWSVYSTREDEVRYFQPFDMQYLASETEDNVDKEIDAIINKYEKVKVTEDTRLVMPIVIINNLYPMDGYVISQNQFNEAADMTGEIKKINLNKNEVLFTDEAIYYDHINDDYIKDIAETKKIALSTSKQDYSFNVVDLRADRIMNGFRMNSVIVVHDDVFDDILKDANNITYLRSFMLKKPLDAEDMINEIDKAIPRALNGGTGSSEAHFSTDRDFESYVFSYHEGFSSYGMLMFIAWFIGGMFLVVTGSVLYYKQLLESDADKVRYNILNNIGVSKRKLSKSIGLQLMFVFGIPFLFGAIDAIFALRMLNVIVPQELMLKAVGAIIAYGVLYFAYYLMTWKNYNKSVLVEQ